MTVDTSGPVHHQRDTLALALNFRQVRPDHEITELGLAARDQVIQAYIDGIEMIHQGFARISVIDEAMVEAWLFKGDSLGRSVPLSVVHGARLAVAAGVHICEDVGVVGLGPAIERCEQVGGVFPQIQFVDVAPTRRPHPGD
jgi:hypothetical protein